MHSYSVSFIIDAKDDDELQAVVSLMIEAAEPFVYVRKDAVAYTHDGTPLRKPFPHEEFFNVYLEDRGTRPISVIKEVRSLVRGIGLKEAKDLVDSSRDGPALILEDLEELAAKKCVAQLEQAGGTASYSRSTMSVEEIEDAKRGLRRVYEELNGQATPS